MPQQKTKTATPQRTQRPLARYQSMRDFKTTAEPQGKERRHKATVDGERALPFVVQKHAASRLHYDFRLGWDGVLKSWAVTKGPSYYPGDKRLAVQVEDHPWEYKDFEGIIPKGQYGGGTVMVWDKGGWLPHGDVDRGLKDGHLKFELHGTKLKGDWVLVRMHGRAGESDKPNWLLIKEKDRFANESDSLAVTEEAPNSAMSGRTMDQIAAGKDRVWDSAKATNGTKAETEQASQTRQRAQAKPASFNKSPLEKFPGFIPPQLAQQTSTSPGSGNWLHELKLDGYRIQIHVRTEGKSPKAKRSAQLFTRKGLDWSARMPDIAHAAAQLNVTSAILDGEAVALDKDGVSNFADLQAAFQEGRQRYITYFAFDLLHLDGHNLRGLALLERKKILGGLLQSLGDGTPLHYSEHIEANGETVFENACALGAEGIVSKLASAGYTSGRGSAWLKRKCHQEQEFVIGGFTLPSKGTAGIGALLLGYYEGSKLRYAGRAGTGFTQSTHKLLRSKLDLLERKESSFAQVPREMRRGAHWVKPRLVAQIEFSTWTRDNLVRQAAYKGLREDKPAAEIVRESAIEGNGTNLREKEPRRDEQIHSRRNHETVANGMATPVITHPNKVLDAESGMTKQDLADYYNAVAEHMLPHIADRPLSLVRCPDGNSKPCFFQKHAGLGVPSGVKTIPIQSHKADKAEAFLAVDSVDGLIALAQMGVLEIHPWGSRRDSLDKPDRIVFDLDPDATIAFETVAKTALELKSRLQQIGLESFVKSTGGKGLHVVVPIRPNHEWPAIKGFAHRLVLAMEKEKPNLYVTKMTKALRKNRIYLDYLRNDRESTSVAPFSPRARSGVPVAMPLRWDELGSSTAPAFHVSDIQTWRGRLRHDPWEKLAASRQSLPAAALSPEKMNGRKHVR
jgi:bifunctional non-homologous end joining protein LigD